MQRKDSTKRKNEQEKPTAADVKRFQELGFNIKTIKDIEQLRDGLTIQVPEIESVHLPELDTLVLPDFDLPAIPESELPEAPTTDRRSFLQGLFASLFVLSLPMKPKTAKDELTLTDVQAAFMMKRGKKEVFVFYSSDIQQKTGLVCSAGMMRELLEQKTMSFDEAERYLKQLPEVH